MRIEEPIPELPQAQLPLPAVADLQDSLMVAHNDLDRLQRLLTDATETLMAHFCGASAAISVLADRQPTRRHLAPQPMTTCSRCANTWPVLSPRCSFRTWRRN